MGGTMRPMTPARTNKGAATGGARWRGGRGWGGPGLPLLTHGLPARQRLLLGVRLGCMVLKQLLGQRDIPVTNLANGPPSNQGLQGPQ